MSEIYSKAKKKGEMAARKALAHGYYPFLTDLGHVLAGRGEKKEVKLGVMEIPMSMVSGTMSQSRGEAFACNFMPIMDVKSEFAAKWSNLYDAQMNEGIRDPIQVYEFLHRFYVAEGNKRVSVLKYLGLPVIQAEVTRVIPRDTESDEVKLYLEFLDFFERAPIYELQFSRPGDYSKLCNVLGLKGDETWPDQLVKDVTSAYYIFEEGYEDRPVKGMSTSDAFLLFLTLFNINCILDRSGTFVKKLQDLMAREFNGKTKPKAIIDVLKVW
ncbi:MAG: hypothetical protein IJ070_02755 [Firmicutes bacterium]|nr:hypothetical protein [Bacillota bacterium]